MDDARGEAHRRRVPDSEHLRSELARLSALPMPDEVRARLQRRAPVKVREQPERIIRRLRDDGRRAS